MSIEWAGWGPQLLIKLDRDRPIPLRSQLESQLRDAIRTGRLGAGERLPSSRALASSLGLSRGLVQDCYVQLQAEGYLTSRTGSATRVAPAAARPRPPASRTRPAPAEPRLLADFRSGVPDLGSAPREDWAWAVREACRTAPNTAFDYGDPQGDPRLRQVLAAYLRRVRAMDVHPEQVVVCTGFAQGLTLLLSVLAQRGRGRVAFEDPGSAAGITAAARAAGGTAVAVPVDEAGIDVSVLERSGARVVVLTPAHQWPTGVVLAPERRHALITWARARDAIVVEDDYDAEFRYDRDPVGALQGLAPDRVATLGTVSKSLAPVLRLGWAALPAALAGEVTGAKRLADRGTPGLDQLALTHLIESGRYDRHLRRMRTEYANRRDVLVESLGRYAPGVRLTGLAAGFHAVAHLPAGTDERAVVDAARARGVGLYGMGTYRSGPAGGPPQLVFGFGNTTPPAIRDGIGAVADLLTGVELDNGSRFR
jgi:GntR family transcriptional regulator/MocR family aminotransferase